ncbi:MAG: cytidylate kinase-like family protein [Lachnospiraceae bacterium]|nr:cytidylate kinase-like family protein [Lachnospiraceae bacterium]
MACNKIITISRQYGSGGREVGELLSKMLNIPYYDNALITRAAKESGFAEAAFEKAEEKATNSLLYSIAMGMNAYGNQEYGFAHLSLDDRIYLAQSEIIRTVADEGPCVIIGRCADYVLKERDDVLHFFIWADLEKRIQRAVELYNMSPSKAEENVLKIDKRRANYYNYHANGKWGAASNYHLSVRSDELGIEKTAELLKKFIELSCAE